MRQLWQRVFIYSLILILLSQTASYLLHAYTVDKEGQRRYITDTMGAIASAMDSRGENTAGRILSIYNNRANRAWVLDPEGLILAGAANEALHPFDPAKSGPSWTDGNVTIYETREDERAPYLAVIPVKLRTGEGVLYMSFRPPNRPDLWSVFSQGLIALTLVGVFLAYWIARRVGRPLRQLRSEVMDIASGDLDQRVTVPGRDEVSDVAEAVNHLSSTLAKNIRGMKQLVANVSHELRSPLARMRISMTLLEENLEAAKEAGKDGRAAAQVTRLKEELEHMDKLIGATMLSSKLDLQKPSKLVNTVDFSGLSREMGLRHALVFEKEGLEFISSIEPGISFKGDETLLCNLVSNLLDNAAKYTDKGGRVCMRLARQGGAALLEVENTHAPIPLEKLEHIFEPFNRAGIATGNGVGLGLHLVRQIAEIHGGEAKAANTKDGFSFCVLFPPEETAQ